MPPPLVVPIEKINLESVIAGDNELTDEGLGRYYEIIGNITRGPLFRWDRLWDIWRINVGGYRGLTARYSPQSGSVSP